MVTHIVCHKYTDREEAKKIAPMLKGLVGKVPGLISMGSRRRLHGQRQEL